MHRPGAGPDVAFPAIWRSPGAEAGQWSCRCHRTRL